MESPGSHDLENPLLSDPEEESKSPLDFQFPSSPCHGPIFRNLPSSLQRKYGNSIKIKWVFNQMLTMNFSQETLFSVFNNSISVDEEAHTKEEILNLAIDTLLAKELDGEITDNINISFPVQSRLNVQEINRPEGSSGDPRNSLFSKPRIHPEDKHSLCGICCGSMVEKSIIPRCEHIFCSQCVFDYLSNLVLNGRVIQIPCPSEDCKNVMTDSEICEFLKSEDILVRKFIKFKKDVEISMDPKHRWCIRPGCEYMVEGDPRSPKATCKCGQIMCFNCMNPWHEGVECDLAIDMEYKRYAEKGRVKNCPRCNSRIEKNEGCNHIHCTRCKFDFCWLCNREYKPGHYEWYNLLGCPLMMYSRLSSSKFHSLILCLKKVALILAIVLGIILLAGLVVALLPVAAVLLALAIPVLFYIKICEPRKDCKGISIGIIVFVLGVPLSPFILLVMLVPGMCVLFCCRNQFEEIYM